MADTATIAQAFQEWSIPVAEGLSINVRDYAAEGLETGLPVVCLHGLTRNARDFEAVAPRIAALGRRVLAMSMRGRGESDRDPDPANYAPPVYVADVIRALDGLGVDDAVFIGTSMGGVITMLTATQHPARVAAAVLNDIGAFVEQAGLARIAGYVGRGQPSANWAGAAETMRAVNGVAFPERIDDDTFWMQFARRTCRERADGMVEADYDPMIALSFADPPAAMDLSPMFQALAPRPVLVVRGAISDLLSAEGVARMRAIKGDLKVVEASNIGHAPTLEEPEVWDAMLDFLARVP